jgi:nicotinamide-nucleotide amidase
MISAAILSVGDELVLGQTVDTNSAWLSAQLASVGVRVVVHQTVGDDQSSIERSIRDLSRFPLLLLTGGIGPTEDDLTRQALAAVLQQPLELNEAWLLELHRFWQRRGRVMPEINRIQAMIPRTATLIHNHAGTAAGIRARVGACDVFVMPGVPKEMKLMFERDVLPHVRTLAGGAVILSRTLHTFSQGESVIAEMLGDLMRRDRNPSVGTTVSGGIVSLRINARFDDRSAAEQALAETEAACRARLGHLVFGTDDETLQQVVVRQLLDARATVATAESCTGGLVAKMITDVPGSSGCFHAGFVVYSNAAKCERLGVNREMLGAFGAVSEPVVEVLARNARRLTRSTYSLAVSGIAGPDGGSPTKPVGTVCLALAFPRPDEPKESNVLVRTVHLVGDREMVRDRAAKSALTLLRYKLLDQPSPF